MRSRVRVSFLADLLANKQEKEASTLSSRYCVYLDLNGDNNATRVPETRARASFRNLRRARGGALGRECQAPSSVVPRAWVDRGASSTPPKSRATACARRREAPKRLPSTQRPVWLSSALLRHQPPRPDAVLPQQLRPVGIELRLEYLACLREREPTTARPLGEQLTLARDILVRA